MADDYIRREEAITEICDCTCGELKDVCKSQEDCSYYEALKLLPSADVVPVVHAHWIRHENADEIDGYEVPMFECSKCRAWKEDDSDYCPDCGAKMDGERKE